MKNQATKKIKLKSYKQALRESFTTMSGMPQDARGYATGYSSRTASHSISTIPGGQTGLHGTLTGTTGYNINDINKIEQETSKAPPLLPFPLDNIFQDLVSSIRYIENVERQLKTSIENNIVLSPEKLKKLMKMRHIVTICKKKMIGIGRHIEDINLDEI